MADDVKVKEEEAATSDPVETKAAEAVVTLPDNFNEVIAETVAKSLEAREAAQKKLNFNGGAVAKAEFTAAEKKAEANLFLKHIANGEYKEAASLKSVQDRAKALDSQTSATAGVLVPEIFETGIYSNFDNFSEIIGDARVITTNQPGDKINLNQLDAKVVVYETAELGTTTASNPSYTAPAVEFTKYTAEVIMSEELLEDTEADLLGNINSQIAEKYAAKIQDRFINRATSNEEGILAASGVTTVNMGNGGSYLNTTFDDLRALKSKMYTAYNKSEGDSAKFYMHGATWWDGAIANLTTSGSPYGQYALDPFQGEMRRALGSDVRLANEIATPTITGTKFAFFADLSKHLIIARKRGMRIKLNTTGTASDGTNLNTQDARQLVMTARIGHSVVLPSGIIVLVS